MIVCSHLPGRPFYRSVRHRVVALPCADDLDYARGLQAVWGSHETIINVEHDMQCSDDLIGELLDCPHPLCTFAYVLYPVTTGRPAHWAQRHGGTNYGEWVETGDEFCDFTGIGFCKITALARVGVLREQHWTGVDMAVHDATAGRWHIHWQHGPRGLTGVEHRHR